MSVAPPLPRTGEELREAIRWHVRHSLGKAWEDATNGDLLDAIKAAGGVDVVLDMVGAAYAELNLNAALAAYENGRVAFAAVLDAHRQLRRARGELVKARGDQQIRLAEIEKMLGEDL